MNKQPYTMHILKPIRTKEDYTRSKYKKSMCSPGFHVWKAETEIGGKCYCKRKRFGDSILTRGFIEVKRS